MHACKPDVFEAADEGRRGSMCADSKYLSIVSVEWAWDVCKACIHRATRALHMHRSLGLMVIRIFVWFWKQFLSRSCHLWNCTISVWLLIRLFVELTQKWPTTQSWVQNHYSATCVVETSNGVRKQALGSLGSDMLQSVPLCLAHAGCTCFHGNTITAVVTLCELV